MAVDKRLIGLIHPTNAEVEERSEKLHHRPEWPEVSVNHAIIISVRRWRSERLDLIGDLKDAIFRLVLQRPEIT